MLKNLKKKILFHEARDFVNESNNNVTTEEIEKLEEEMKKFKGEKMN